MIAHRLNTFWVLLAQFIWLGSPGGPVVKKCGGTVNVVGQLMLPSSHGGCPVKWGLAVNVIIAVMQ